MHNNARNLARYSVYISIFSVMLGLGVVFPVLPDIQEEFSASYSEISLAVSAFAIARLITNIPAGIAGARFPPLFLLLIGSMSVVIGSLSAATSPSLEVLLISRAVSGFGSSITTTIGLSYILENAEVKSRGKASGTFHAALSGGAFLGPGIGGIIASIWDWRAALLGAAIVTLASSILLAVTSLKLGREKEPKRRGRKNTGTRTRSLSGNAIRGLLILGASAYATAFAIFFVRGAIQQTLVPLIGRDTIGLSTLNLSILLMIAAAVGSLLGPFAGELSDRLGRTRVIVPSLVVLIIGIAVLTTTSTEWLFITGVLATGIAGSTNGIPSAMLADSFASDMQRVAISVYRVIGDSALMIAPIISGTVVDLFGFQWAGFVAIIVIAISLLLSTRPQRNGRI